MTATFRHDLCPYANKRECHWWKSTVNGVHIVCVCSPGWMSAVSQSLTGRARAGGNFSVYSSLLVLSECSLLLCVLYNLLLHIEAFAAADSVHVFEGLVGRVCFFSEVQVFFLGGGNPAWITADHLGYIKEERDRDMMASDG